ncbi:hypothetical protein FRC05_004500 [Tulasnella sp. 425]|nr:hypothetical protein FRC05_004500 [Tulasnella sp. 425]
MTKYPELISYEEAFPEIPVVPRQSQRIKRTGTLARLSQSIRIAQRTNTQYTIDVYDRFQFEIQKILAILQIAVFDEEERTIIIPYQPSELQLVRIYQILPVDRFVIAKEWNNRNKDRHLQEILHLMNQSANRKSNIRYRKCQNSSASLEHHDLHPSEPSSKKSKD